MQWTQDGEHLSMPIKELSNYASQHCSGLQVRTLLHISGTALGTSLPHGPPIFFFVVVNTLCLLYLHTVKTHQHTEFPHTYHAFLCLLTLMDQRQAQTWKRLYLLSVSTSKTYKDIETITELHCSLKIPSNANTYSLQENSFHVVQ